MNTLEKHNNEVQDNLMKLWDEKKDSLGLGEYSDEIALHIKNQNTELLKKIAEGEVERLNKYLSQMSGNILDNWENGVAQAVKYEKAHWQQVLEDLEK